MNTDIDPDIPDDSKALVELCRMDLLKNLPVEPIDVEVLSVTSTNFNDTSLGCPQPDTSYAQVMTPGFVIVLKASGIEFEYHTDTSSAVVLCNPKQPADASMDPPLETTDSDLPTPTITSSKPDTDFDKTTPPPIN